MSLLVHDHLERIQAPANLRINDQIRAFREACLQSGCARPYHHLAFGQSPFSPPASVIEALAGHASQHAYLPTGGMHPLRERIAQWYSRTFGLDCTAKQVVVGPGSKEMIAISLAVLQGTLLVPTPSWVSYLPQAKIIKKDVIAMRTRREDGFKVTPELLEENLRQVASKRAILLLNHPNNPTGAVYDDGELAALAATCRKYGLVVLSDEIYALTTFDAGRFTSMSRIYPEGTIVTGGLSKDRSCGGYRFGVLVAPRNEAHFVANVLKVAGSTYSCVAAPIQYAAMEAYSGNDAVQSHVRDCTRLHALAGRTMASMMAEIDGVVTTVPQGAFYLYVDFNAYRGGLRELGMHRCADFCENLLAQEHTAMLPGDALLLPPEDYSVRCCYVDYDGDRALEAWRSHPPSTEQAQHAFVKEHFPLLTGGAASIRRYLESLRQGRRPEHDDAPADDTFASLGG